MKMIKTNDVQHSPGIDEVSQLMSYLCMCLWWKWLVKVKKTCF